MNTGATKRVLCFGDSNTWGYTSGTDHHRLPSTKRWTGILQSILGESFEIIEEGLNSRTISNQDPRPGKEGRNADIYLSPCLDSHDPIDIVILLLGTNELKGIYKDNQNGVFEVFKNQIIEEIINKKSQFLKTSPQLIGILLPRINKETEYAKSRGYNNGTDIRRKQFNATYLELSKKQGFNVIDSDAIGLEPGIDGVHL
ncbi:MAG TPA: GDSL-type esterase/lipase family protein, partial [Candidatus Absconditabacterales bacterium]|nr:GDSL-type esterase/lipase family protein [Candidatus Absconditabacterales bacterium]